ncbi:hypothetical protein [Rhizobium sp. N122]|uniref:hypothetical protein n=1 Tax=Rhizobium sp. N122 TaxID=1764272 RepID=UPI00167E4FCF|nr:hypothetical protein [Rhizobium sp. N122]
MITPFRRCDQKATCGQTGKRCDSEKSHWLPAPKTLGQIGDLAEILALYPFGNICDALADFASVAADLPLIRGFQFRPDLLESLCYAAHLMGGKVRLLGNHLVDLFDDGAGSLLDHLLRRVDIFGEFVFQAGCR